MKYKENTRSYPYKGKWFYYRDNNDGQYAQHAGVRGPYVHIDTSGNLHLAHDDLMLIAAAPELLEELKRLVDVIDSGEPPRIDITQELIAKIEGKEDA